MIWSRKKALALSGKTKCAKGYNDGLLQPFILLHSNKFGGKLL